MSRTREKEDFLSDFGLDFAELSAHIFPNLDVSGESNLPSSCSLTLFIDLAYLPDGIGKDDIWNAQKRAY